MKKILLKIIFSLLILLIAFNILLVIYIKERDKEICLKEEYKRLEYGERYDPKLDDLIDLNKFNFLDEEKILIESNLIIEENKEYPAVGKYNIKVKYKDKSLEQVVEITDTTNPELSIQEIIEIDYNTDLSTYDFGKYITTKDLSELKDYVIDLANINSGVSGEYETVISCEDVYGNKTEKKFKIKILEKIEEVEKEEIVPEVITKKKDEEVKKKTTASSKKSDTKTTKDETTTSKKQENDLPVEENNNSNDASTEEKKEDKKEENYQEKEYTIVVNPNKCTHGEDNYYDTREEAIALYKNKVKECSEKLKNKEIKTYEEYIKVCPYGYQDWSCPYCGKWTIEMYYR